MYRQPPKKLALPTSKEKNLFISKMGKSKPRIKRGKRYSYRGPFK